MTLDRLAGMIERRFDEIEGTMVTKEEFNSRLGGLESRFGDLERKVDKLDFQIDEVYDILKRFEETDILNLQKRVHVLEKAVRALADQASK